jgi:RNA polymerase sigma factor (sigma-70 family)
MIHTRLNAVLHYLRGVAGPEGQAEGSDGQLLERFIARRDEAAFTALLRRHGPLVWGVCRRILARTQDAEDAFQATWLVLVRKADSIGKRESVRSWLYGVAQRVAVRARATQRRQAASDSLLADVAARGGDSPDLVWRDLRPVLDEEVSRLPEKYRLPVILCCLEGKTNDEAARELGCPRNTVASRLARARERLRSRLTRRGVTLSAALLAGVLARNAEAAGLPAALGEASLRAAQAARDGGARGGVISAQAALWSEAAGKSLAADKVKAAGVVLLLLGLAGSGAGLLAVGSGVPKGNADSQAPVAQQPNATPGAGRDEKNAKDDSKRPVREEGQARTEALADRLAEPVEFPRLDDPETTLAEVLDHLEKRYDVTIAVNEAAFQAAGVPDVRAFKVVGAEPIPKSNNFRRGLQKVLGRIKTDSPARFVVRDDAIEITTEAALRAELGKPADAPLLPLVRATLERVPLDEALQRLAGAAGFNVVLDTRVARAAKVPVSTRFNNVPLDTAVRLLADMAELQSVQIDNVLYVTTRENAARIAKEQQQKKSP